MLPSSLGICLSEAPWFGFSEDTILLWAPDKHAKLPSLWEKEVDMLRDKALLSWLRRQR